MFGMQDSPSGKVRRKASPTPQTGDTVSGGFTAEETSRLEAARDRYLSGQMNEWAGDYKRLKFARWLYEQGRISG